MTDHDLTGLEKPIFIIGSPRSGTTVFMNIISFHPSFAYPSNYVNRFPSLPELSLLSRVHDLPLIGGYFKKSYDRKLVPSPVEAWSFFNAIDSTFRDLSRAADKLGEAKLTEEVVQNYHARFRKILKWHNRKRLIAKYTHRPRIEYFNQIFQAPYFLHVQRNPLAVVHSMYQKRVRENWFYEEQEAWKEFWGEEIWNEIKHAKFSDLAYLSYLYSEFMKRIRGQRSNIPEKRFMDIDYCDFTEHKLNIFREVLDFLELDWSKDFETWVKHFSVENKNYKYKKTFDERQLRLSKEIIERQMGAAMDGVF